MDEAAPTTPSLKEGMPPEVAKLIELFNDKLASDSKRATYANNTRFESSVWDLKITFGQLEQDVNRINWHTAITIPWFQAKILAYFLFVNLAFHEHRNGPLKVPSGVKPNVPTPPTDEELLADPRAAELIGGIKELYDEMFG